MHEEAKLRLEDLANCAAQLLQAADVVLKKDGASVHVRFDSDTDGNR